MQMNRIYQIKYEEKWSGCREWLPDSTNVLANGDAQKAVDKVKRQSLTKSYKAEDAGKVQKCVAFRLREVSMLAEAS